MVAYRVSELGYADLDQHLINAVANSSAKDDYGTLILDRFGQIRSSGTNSERIFGTTKDRLIGKPVSAFIDGLFFDTAASSFGARYLAYLSRESEWREFSAVSGSGQSFVLELKLSRIATQSEEMFLLNLRRSEKSTHSQ